MGSKTKRLFLSFVRSSISARYFFFIVILLASGSLFAQADSAGNAITAGNFSRLLVAPTARSLPEDNGYINLAEIIFPNFGYGITDEFMVRGGFTPFTVSGRILYFGLAQLQVAEYGDLTISGGIILTDITGSVRNWENTFYGFGIVSYGNDVAAIHAGFGGGYSSTRESSSAIFMIGGEWKVARTTKVISENWIVSETGSGAYSLGLRIFGTTLAGELGGVIITAQHSFKIETIVPWIGITFIL
jgi:hypothetical protein